MVHHRSERTRAFFSVVRKSNNSYSPYSSVLLAQILALGNVNRKGGLRFVGAAPGTL
jgi:hypothetical protein